MRSHVALLRGINVGGHNKVAMADLREVVAALGFEDVATYVQSGNVVFGAEAPGAEEIRDAIAERLGVECDVVVLSRDELARVVADNPFPDEQNPKELHAVFGADPDPHAVAAAQERYGDGEAAVVGGVLYMRTPGGIGRNKLAAALARTGRQGTARNWATVTKLLDLLDS